LGSGLLWATVCRQGRKRAILKSVALRKPDACRMILMNKGKRKPRAILKRLGKVHWNRTRGAFVVETDLGAVLQLCPNSEEDIRAGVHVDEIAVPKARQGRRAATKAMGALCHVADEEGIVLKGGPIGWSGDPMSGRFVAWLKRFGIERDPSPPTKVHDRTAFYAQRLPRSLREGTCQL